MRDALCFLLGVLVFNLFWYISGIDFPTQRGSDLLGYSGLLIISGAFGFILFDDILPRKLKILGFNLN